MLKADKVRYENGVKINEKIIPDNARATKYIASWVPKGGKMKPGGTMKPIGITVHNTSDLKNVNDDAEQYARATYPNGNMAGVVVHYYVDDLGAWQLLRENEPGWHASDGNGNGNKRTIAIETIMDGTGSAADLKARDNAARLCASLLNKYGWTIDDIYTHNHWMGLPDKIVKGVRKNCPIYLLPDWNGFLKLVQSYVKGGKPVEEPTKKDTENDIPVIPDKSFLVKITCKSLNIRSGPGLDYKVVGVIKDKGTYTILEESNGWGKLKSKMGWIRIDPKYNKRV